MSGLINEMRRVIAFVFRRAGVEEMKKSEFYLDLSMRLRWCNVEDAKRFLGNAVDMGLFEEKGEYVKPSFSVEDVEIPLDFKPSSDVFTFKGEEVKRERVEKKGVEALVSTLVESTDFETVSFEIKKLVEEKQVVDEVATLLFAHKKGLDVSSYVDEAFNAVKSEASTVE